MDNRKPLDGVAAGLMVVLALTWSLQQIAIKQTAAEVAPVLMIGLRSGIAAVLVAGLMWWCGEKILAVGTPWRAAVAIGVLFAGEYILLGEALRLTSAGHAVVLLYTAPLFAALGLQWALPSERLSLVQWGGILLAFVGIACTFWGRSGGAVSPQAQDMLIGDALALLAGLAWGATTVVIRVTPLAQLPATPVLFYQLFAAFVLLVPAAFLMGQGAFHPSVAVWGNLAFQSVGVAFLSFLVWFWLLRHYLASRLGVFSFLTPLCGVALGILLLNEPLESAFLFGAFLVLLGIALVSSARLIESTWRRWLPSKSS